MTGLSVQTRGLTVRYGRHEALAEVDLDLPADGIHGLLGRNAAGKTTLLSTLASLRRPSSGRVLIDGEDPFENEPLMERIALVRESGDVIADEKLSTNLDFLQMCRPSFDRPYAERLLEEFELDLSSKPQKLSRGKQSAFGAVAGLASRAALTLFDEVHLGMDAPSRQRFYELLLEDYSVHPRTIVLSSHLIAEVETLLETVSIVHQGRLMLSASADGLRRRGATLTGPAALVDAATARFTVVGSRDLGPTRQVTVYGDLDEADLSAAQRDGLQVGPVPLQELFIHLTGPAEPRTPRVHQESR